jgi:hypothetical protein
MSSIYHYAAGFVDVWSNEEGTEPCYTIHCDGSLPRPSSLQLTETSHTAHLALSFGHTVQIHHVTGREGQLKAALNLDSVVNASFIVFFVVFFVCLFVFFFFFFFVFFFFLI